MWRTGILIPRTSRLSILVGFVVAFTLLLSNTLAYSATFKPIILDPSYNHTKYAPQCSDQDILRKFRAYATCFDGPDDDDGDGVPDKWAVPHWVAYEIKRYPGVLGKGPKRPPRWITDSYLFARGIAPSDDSYRFSREFREANPESPQLGYDRGHMAMKQHAWRLGPNADWNTHTVLNACPQRSKLNQGIWLDLEQKTAEWADRYGAVWVITGPIFYGQKPSRWLGEPGEVPVGIPDAFFKIVVRVMDEQVAVLAFIYPNQDNLGDDLTAYLTSVDRIEELTGLDFLAVLDDEVEEVLESEVAVDLWH